MSELKNCPFCGGEAETKMYRWGEKQDGEAIWCYYIFCTNCQSMSDNLFTDKDCAIAAWNTRTASPRFTAEEREAMNYCMNTTRDLDPWSGYAATQMYILCYDEIDLYMSALRFLCECGQEKVEKSKEATQ